MFTNPRAVPDGGYTVLRRGKSWQFRMNFQKTPCGALAGFHENRDASPIARLADKLNDISLIFPPPKNIVFEGFALLAIVYWLARHWKVL